MSTGWFREFNDAAEQMFGFTKVEILGKTLNPLMPPRLRDAHTAGLQRYLRRPASSTRWSNVERARHDQRRSRIPSGVFFLPP